MRKNKFIKVEKEIDDTAEKMFREGMSITAISRELGIDRGCLSKRLKIRGFDIIQHCNKKNVDSRYFEEINTEEKAYWLGMMYADGCVTYGSKFELTLKDKDHIEKFKSALKSKHKIGERIINEKSYYRLSIMDKRIHDSLIRHGCLRNKTFYIKMPSIYDNLMRHFIRGFFDGDGCIFIGKNQNESQIKISSGCNDFLEELCSYINNNIEVCRNMYTRKTHTCFDISIFNMADKRMFLDYMYKDSTIYLERKYQKYLHYCRLESKNRRRLKIINGKWSWEAIKC